MLAESFDEEWDDVELKEKIQTKNKLNILVINCLTISWKQTEIKMQILNWS